MSNHDELIDSANTMRQTIDYAQMKGIGQAYPDRTVAEMLDRLVSALKEAQAENERMHSWDGLMALLDEHWPADIFPTMDDREDRDPGPRIVSLIRWVEQLRAHSAHLERLIRNPNVVAAIATVDPDNAVEVEIR